MQIYLTKHARDKFEVLARHGVVISQSQVEEVLGAPDVVDESRAPLLVAQKALDDQQVLRVVFKEENTVKLIITFYPGKKKHYESGAEE